jgi:hypothetical protein
VTPIGVSKGTQSMGGSAITSPPKGMMIEVQKHSERAVLKRCGASVKVSWASEDLQLMRMSRAYRGLREPLVPRHEDVDEEG